ncbi:hypothetical protein QUA13_06540 [Microcoleus sp. S28C3]
MSDITHILHHSQNRLSRLFHKESISGGVGILPAPKKLMENGARCPI